jgi:predicted HTH transcriptional regulator
MRQRFVTQPYILKWIAEGEHFQQDFKLRVDDARKISKTLSAFSNTVGGRLLIGVKDNGQIAGVKQEEEYHMLEWAAEKYCTPAIQLSYQTWKIDDKIILEVQVPEAIKKPILAEYEINVSKAFLRDHDENILAPSVMKDVWQIAETDRPEKFFYSEKEQALLHALDQGESTLSKLARTTGIKRQVLQKILAKLIRWEIVDWRLIDGIAHFQLRE